MRSRRPSRVSSVGLRALELRALRVEVGLDLRDLRAVERRVDLGEDVALLHDRVEVDVDARDAPVDLRADVDLEQRLHRARRLHLLDDVAHRDRAPMTYLAGGGGRCGHAPAETRCNHRGDDGPEDRDAAEPEAAALFGGQCFAQIVGGGRHEVWPKP